MTTILRLSTAITNPQAPTLVSHDNIESEGSLFLWDAGKQRYNSIPSANDALPNLLFDFPLASDKSFSIYKGNSVSTDDYVQMQLSSKGGLHLIAAQNYPGEIENNACWGVMANDILISYLANKIMNNPNLYISFWTQGTRVSRNLLGKFAVMAVNTKGNAANSSFVLHSKNENASVSSNSESESKLAAASRDSAFLAPNHYNMNIKGYLGDGVNDDSVLYIGNGIYGAWYSGFSLNESPSYILYRVYIEDLAVSGRTYAEVKAIDDAEFNKAFAPGGRFYNDTWSDPTSVLA